MTLCVINPLLGGFSMLSHLIFTTTKYFMSQVLLLCYGWENWDSREVKWIAQSHTGNEGQTQDLNQACLQNCDEYLGEN